MKKILAAVLAAAMTLGMASVAFAADQIKLEPATSTGNHDYIEVTSATKDGSYVNFEDTLYTCHDGESVTFELCVPVKEEVDVDVDSGKVSVSKKKIAKDLTLGTGEDAHQVDVYEITVKSKAGMKDISSSSWTVEIYCDDLDVSVYAKGSVAYSQIQDVESGENYKVGDKGCIFSFDEVLDEEVRIAASKDVDLYFKGNYGLDKEVLHINEGNIEDLEKFFDDEDIDCYDFVAAPKFAKAVTIHIDADSDTHIYEFDKVSGDLVDITDECEYDDNGFYFSRKVLGTYVVTEEVYEGGNAYVEEPAEEPADDSAAEGSKPNPGTGAY